MTGNRLHVGIIRPTVPTPQTFFGSVTDVSGFLDVTYKSASDLIHIDGRVTSRGWRRMTKEEESDNWVEQGPRASNRKGMKYQSRKHWKITLFRYWKKSEPYPQESCRRFSGTPKEFKDFAGCSMSQVYRIIDTHDPASLCKELHTVKGWRVARIRKYTKLYKRRSLKEIRDGKVQ